MTRKFFLLALLTVILQEGAAANLTAEMMWPQGMSSCERALTGPSANKASSIRTMAALLKVSSHEELDQADVSALIPEMQGHLESVPSFAAYQDLIEQLLALSRRMDDAPPLKNGFPAISTNKILSMVDFVRPLMPFRDQLTSAHKTFLRNSLRELLKVPDDSQTWNMHGILKFKIMDLFFDPAPTMKVASQIVNVKELMFLMDMQVDYFSGPWLAIFTPSAASALQSLPVAERQMLATYLRRVVLEQKGRMKSAQKVGNEDAETTAMLKRRNAEVLLNFLQRDLLLGLREALEKSPLESTAANVEEYWHKFNGHESEVGFVTVVKMAREVQLAWKKLNLKEDLFWVGSFPNGRAKAASSDMDLIFDSKLVNQFLKDFEEGFHGDINVAAPLTIRGSRRAETMLAARRRINSKLLNRPPETPLFSSAGGEAATATSIVGRARQHLLLFQYGGLNQSLSIRITSEHIYLELYDASAFTNYELDVSSLGL